MRILYSYCKEGVEAAAWEKCIRDASNSEFEFIPFNHGAYLDSYSYSNAQKLDVLYCSRDSRLLHLYDDLKRLMVGQDVHALLVNNFPPYHPDFLKDLRAYKVLYSQDDPSSTYIRNIPYLHAYQHVFFVCPSHNEHMNMKEKMAYCGMVNADLLPISAMEYTFDENDTYESLLNSKRDIDIIYVGNFFRQKIEMLCKIKKEFGSRFVVHGFYNWKHNIYLNVKYGFGQWIRPVSFPERLKLYRRAKIGINIHWNNYGLGNERLFNLPANGVMQICDCADYVNNFFEVGKEIETYRSVNELKGKIYRYLSDDAERSRLAMNGYSRVMNEYRFRDVTRKAGQLILNGMNRIGWPSC